MPVFLEMRDGAASDDATHAVAHQVDDDVVLLVLFQVVSDVFLDLLGQHSTHGFDVPVSVVFVAFGD